MFPSSVRHRKQLSIPSPPNLLQEMTSIRHVREQVARKTHFNLEDYFIAKENEAPTESLPKQVRSMPRIKPKLKEYVTWEPIDEVLSPKPKKRIVSKGLRNVRTFLPPPIRKRPSSRDLLIQDSLQLMQMKKQLESYLLRSPKAAYDYYC